MLKTTIDLVSVERGNAILTLRQTNPWDDPHVLENINARLNGYVEVVKEGALLKKHPQLAGKPIRIRLLCYYYPPDDVLRIFTRTRLMLAELHIGFEIVQIEIVDQSRAMDGIKRAFASFKKLLCGKR